MSRKCSKTLSNKTNLHLQLPGWTKTSISVWTSMSRRRRRPMNRRGFRKLLSEKLWASFSFPRWMDQDVGKGGLSLRGVAFVRCGFDRFGGSGEHLALLLLVLQNKEQRGNRYEFWRFVGYGGFGHDGYPLQLKPPRRFSQIHVFSWNSSIRRAQETAELRVAWLATEVPNTRTLKSALGGARGIAGPRWGAREGAWEGAWGGAWAGAWESAWGVLGLRFLAPKTGPEHSQALSWSPSQAPSRAPHLGPALPRAPPGAFFRVRVFGRPLVTAESHRFSQKTAGNRRLSSSTMGPKMITHTFLLFGT